MSDELLRDLGIHIAPDDVRKYLQKHGTEIVVTKDKVLSKVILRVKDSIDSNIYHEIELTGCTGVVIQNALPDFVFPGELIRDDWDEKDDF